MGAWGVLPFENDSALDWVWSLEEANNTSILTDTLETVVSTKEIVDDCEEAVSAAEVVAALRGNPLPGLPDEVAAFVKTHEKQKPSPKLIKLAATAAQRIADGSELKESWDESNHANEWQEVMRDFLRRLEE